jgi:hypothetical protein
MTTIHRITKIGSYHYLQQIPPEILAAIFKLIFLVGYGMIAIVYNNDNQCARDGNADSSSSSGYGVTGRWRMVAEVAQMWMVKTVVLMIC